MYGDAIRAELKHLRACLRNKSKWASEAIQTIRKQGYDNDALKQENDKLYGNIILAMAGKLTERFDWICPSTKKCIVSASHVKELPISIPCQHCDETHEFSAKDVMVEFVKKED